MAASTRVASDDVLQVLDEMEESIRKISDDSDQNDYEELLLEAEILLQDVVLLSELLPVEDGVESLVKSVADIYMWIEGKRSVHSSRRGRPEIKIDENQLLLLLSFRLSCVIIAESIS